MTKEEVLDAYRLLESAQRNFDRALAQWQVENPAPPAEQWVIQKSRKISPNVTEITFSRGKNA